jgi:organic radical activating enzyme
MKPHPDNACSGKYDDWIEVNLLPNCNARCAWCIENKGWHPTEKASWQEIVRAAIDSGKTNIMLLGGEPTLHKDLGNIVKALSTAGKKVWITTNGSRLTKAFVRDYLWGIAGINISIHDSSLDGNQAITKIPLDFATLQGAVLQLKAYGASIRLNCNCIKWHVDSAQAIKKYIAFAKSLGVDSVRFAELKDDDNSFINLPELLKGEHGLTNDPYVNGCSIDSEIDGMPVNFRIMCGLQTNQRPMPENPEQTLHGVLYYDGKIYDGWQRLTEEAEMAKTTELENQAKQLVKAIKDGSISETEAIATIKTLLIMEHGKGVEEGKASAPSTSGGGCRY